MGLLDFLKPHHNTHPADSPIVRLSDVTVRFNGKPVLDNVSFDLERGERIAVVGPNGAGKSTLFQVLAGLLKPEKGKVEIFGSEPDRHICLAYLPQRNPVDWNFPVSVRDVVMMGRAGRIGLARGPRKRDHEIVDEALRQMHLEELGGRRINELSGGQQQRVFLARALAQEAELMLLDEPLAGLDVNTKEDVFRGMDVMRERGVTVLVAEHDLKLAAERFDRVMLLNRRIVSFDSPETSLHSENLSRAYAGHLHMVETEDGQTLAIGDTCCDHGEEHP
jgi:manganese/iron transport system ATP-binding protein